MLLWPGWHVSGVQLLLAQDWPKCCLLRVLFFKFWILSVIYFSLAGGRVIHFGYWINTCNEAMSLVLFFTGCLSLVSLLSSESFWSLAVVVFSGLPVPDDGKYADACLKVASFVFSVLQADCFCPICATRLGKRSLKRHLANVHAMGAPEMPTCPHCARSFNRKDNLRRHLITRHQESHLEFEPLSTSPWNPLICAFLTSCFIPIDLLE